MKQPKAVVFCGSSRKDLRDFPEDARREAGLELWAVQNDQEPSDWKPMSAIGVGVREIRIRDATGAYRVIYVARIKDKLHVLHAFKKKTQQTAQKDIELARTRYRAILAGDGEFS